MRRPIFLNRKSIAQHRCSPKSCRRIARLRSNQCQPTGLLKPVRHIRLMDNLFFSDLGIGDGKNWLVKTKLDIVARAVFATIILSTPVLFAGSGYDISKETPPLPPQHWRETPPTLEIRLGAPGWLAGLSGDDGVKGVVASPDASFDQLITHLTHVPIVLSADIRYKRWEFFGDGQSRGVGASAARTRLFFINANLPLQTGLAEGFIGYRLINCDKAALSFFAARATAIREAI